MEELILLMEDPKRWNNYRKINPGLIYFNHLHLSNKRLVGLNLSKVVFLYCHFTDSIFENCDFHLAGLTGSRFNNCKFIDTSFKSVSLKDVMFRKPDFTFQST
jgi:uncharacterized protein YjbI with pentapeptide repeats